MVTLQRYGVIIINKCTCTDEFEWSQFVIKLLCTCISALCCHTSTQGINFCSILAQETYSILGVHASTSDTIIGRFGINFGITNHDSVYICTIVDFHR